jgi:LacI family transcriptional regulator
MSKILDMPFEKSKVGISVISPVTYRQQVRNLILAHVRNNKLRPGDKLPSLREMGKKYGVSIGTINKAIQELEQDGLLVSKPQVGVFVGENAFERNESNKDSVVLKKHSTVLFLTTYSEVPDSINNLDNFWDNLISLVMRQVASEGYTVAHFPVHENESDVLKSVPQFVLDHECLFGIIYQGRNLSQIASLEKAGVPVIYAHCMWSSEISIPRVCIDAKRVGYDAVKYLYKKNYRRIGFIGCMEKNVGIIDALKYEGYAQAFAELGLDPRAEYCWPCLPRYQPAAKITNLMLDSLVNIPEAFVAANDYVAMGLIDTLNKRGIKCPEDVAVIGCDDIELASRFTPPLTTFGFDHKEFSEKLFKMLVKRTNNPKSAAENEFITTRLIERTSA